MRLTRCDRCGCVMDSPCQGYVFYLSGARPFIYQDRDGDDRSSDDFEYDLCVDCARDVVTEIELYNAEEGRHV